MAERRQTRITVTPVVYNATLERRDDYTPELAVFHVRYDEPLAESFEPGQYVALGMNNEEVLELGSVRRSMSIASAPEEGDVLQFYVRFVRRAESPNPLTHLLWKAGPGARLFMTRKPVGKFTLRDTTGADDRKKLLVAAGTGLAPFVSMARSRVLRDPESDLSDLVILHGTSYEADLVFRGELEGYAQRNGLVYLPTLSRPDASTAWTGRTGRVEDFFLQSRLPELEERIGMAAGELRPERVAVLICGLQGTIANTITRLLGRGFLPFDRKIRRALEIGDSEAPSMWWEQYDSSPVLEIDDPAVVADLRARVAAGR